ncbi:MAG: adenylosuccinate lyase [Candidatus Tectomicrobia bacterium]|uniref:Adenylosuccinate lyase n=1 Tax=Tectimicrobiota bacterium TaxID=2528274 RepID=A0A932GRE1_UNCTE|nr:adenylosuccinate lyase [Candidatus Tectomicrobia bacterium]
MIPRYSRPAMTSIWSDENKYRKWLEVEILCCEAWSRLGVVPAEAVERIRHRARFDPGRIDEIEKTVRHDVIAFLTNVAESVGEDSRFIHIGLTSSDLLDTTLALQLREAADLILEDLARLEEVLERRAREYKLTPVIGRTHGIHAEPTTFGLKLALWYADAGRSRERMARARGVINYGKISGAVGTFAHVPPAVEEYVCQRLGLQPAPISTQIIQRDRHAEFLAMLALVGGMVEKVATEVRHLQRTEVLEAEEFFAEGQKGSSAMPHKRNPVGAEQLCGLARLVRGYVVPALENVPLWHERDISHSSVERLILPDSTIAVDYMLWRLAGILDQLLVYPERMAGNLVRSQGLFFSQRVLLALTQKGLSREEAYGLVQSCAMAAWRGEGEFKVLLKREPGISRHLSQEEIEDCFSMEFFLRHVDTIFQRVFGGKES